MESRSKTILEFVRQGGRNPFRLWLRALKDLRAQATIDSRLTRVRLGNFGHCRSIGGSLWELKIDYGPGYRVYFGQDGDTVIILLCGGDKSTQEVDIKKARLFWAEYRER